MTDSQYRTYKIYVSPALAAVIVSVPLAFVIANPDSPASRCILALTDTLMRGGKMNSVSKGWRGFLDRLFGY